MRGSLRSHYHAMLRSVIATLYVIVNSQKYKKICDRPDVLPKSVLMETRDILVKGNLIELNVNVIEKALLGGIIQFPENYSGDPSTSYHKVSCSFEEAENIADYLFEKEAESVPVSGIGTSETSKLVRLVNIWHDFVEYV